MKIYLTFILLFGGIIITLGQNQVLQNTAKSVEILPSGIRAFHSNVLYDSTNVGSGNATLKSLAIGQANTVVGDSNAVLLNSVNGNTLVGSSIMKTSATGSYNTIFGAAAGQNWSGSNLIAMGVGSASDQSNIAQNINLGAFTGLGGTSGNHIVIGTGAGLNANKIGSVIIGSGAALNLNAGINSIYLGASVAANTTQTSLISNNNIGIGYQSLFQNGTADESIAIGYRTMANNVLSTTPSRDVAIGYLALEDRFQESFNIAIGKKSQKNNGYGISNISIGNEALFGLRESGQYNIGIGSFAGGFEFNDNNIAGFRAGNHNIFIGYSSAASSSDQVYDNVAVGSRTLESLTNLAQDNVAIGANAGQSISNGSSNTFIGSGADRSLLNFVLNSTAIGYNAKATFSNQVVFGDANVTLVEGKVLWTVYSDKRLKKDIEYDKKLGLGLIQALKPAYYNNKTDPQKNLQLGIMADDLEDYLEANKLSFSALQIGNDRMKTKSVAYEVLTVPLINAIQELDVKLSARGEWEPMDISSIKDQLKSKN